MPARRSVLLWPRFEGEGNGLGLIILLGIAGTLIGVTLLLALGLALVGWGLIRNRKLLTTRNVLAVVMGTAGLFALVVGWP
jgi:hypothetical protein